MKEASLGMPYLAAQRGALWERASKSSFRKNMLPYRSEQAGMGSLDRIIIFLGGVRCEQPHSLVATFN